MPSTDTSTDTSTDALIRKMLAEFEMADTRSATERTAIKNGIGRAIAELVKARAMEKQAEAIKYFATIIEGKRLA